MKVLIISHNPISTFNNMGRTIGSLFSGFAKEELCQLYIHPSVPDLQACNSYYRITDRDVLMSFVKFRVHGGIVQPDTDQHMCSDDSKSGKLYRKMKQAGTTKRLIRDVLWKSAYWNNANLKEWIRQEQPTCIFVAPGMQKFLYDIALVIAKQRGIPIISYICDDYYFLQRKANPVIRYANWTIRCKIEKLMKKSDHVVFICNPLKEAYQSHFHISSATTIMTGTTNEIFDEILIGSSVETFVYMGNLYYNRDKSLADIGRVLDEINAANNTSCHLDIYSGDISDSVREEFKGINSVKLFGFVSGAEYERVRSEADVFIHVEGFDKESFDMVKYSVSTKIADSLASGKVFLAYGPAEVASMRHLTDNHYICAVSDRESLKGRMCAIMKDEQFRTDCVKDAYELASEYHKQDVNSQKLRDIFYS